MLIKQENQPCGIGLKVFFKIKKVSFISNLILQITVKNFLLICNQTFSKKFFVKLTLEDNWRQDYFVICAHILRLQGMTFLGLCCLNSRITFYWRQIKDHNKVEMPHYPLYSCGKKDKDPYNISTIWKWGHFDKTKLVFKMLPVSWSGNMSTEEVQIFPKRYCESLRVKGMQSYKMSKLVD